MLINTKKKRCLCTIGNWSYTQRKGTILHWYHFFKDDTDIKIKHMCKIEHRYKLCLTTQTRFSLDKKTAKNEMKNALEKHIVFLLLQ